MHRMSSQVSGSQELPWEHLGAFIRTPLIGTRDYAPTVPQLFYFVVGPVTDNFISHSVFFSSKPLRLHLRPHLGWDQLQGMVGPNAGLPPVGGLLAHC